jgi:hypothetical protein
MGAPVHSEIYEENRSEPSTLAGIIDSLAAVNTISAPLSIAMDLGLRPVYHQKTERTAAHLFISVLAYHIMAAIEYDLRANGDTRRFSTIKEILSTHIRSTIIFTDDKDQIHHLRVSSTPEACHKEIYDTLKVK